MSTQYFNRLKKQLTDCARQHYRQLLWGMSLNPTELSTLFATLKQSAANKGTLPRRITIGNKVTLFNAKEKEIITLVLTNSRDNNPENGFISCFPPLGRQLIGRMAGDVMGIKIFYRTTIFRIIRIED